MYIPTESGHWVDENFCRLSEIIRDYDPYLELQWIEPRKRETKEEKEKPFRIVDTRSNYIVMYASDRSSAESILSALFNRDNTKGDVLKTLDANNAAVEAFEYKKILEDREAAKDFTAFVFRNKKNYWRHAGKKYDDQFRELR